MNGPSRAYTILYPGVVGVEESLETTGIPGALRSAQRKICLLRSNCLPGPMSCPHVSGQTISPFLLGEEGRGTFCAESGQHPFVANSLLFLSPISHFGLFLMVRYEA